LNCKNCSTIHRAENAPVALSHTERTPIFFRRVQCAATQRDQGSTDSRA
jgi:hypothetical protein